MNQAHSYSSVFLVLLGMLLLLLFTLHYPPQSFKLKQMGYVFVYGLSVILCLVWLYQTIFG